jgi:hypothetical protein
MSPKWFHRVRELFQDGFVANPARSGNTLGGATPSVRKALKKLGKSRCFV